MVKLVMLIIFGVFFYADSTQAQMRENKTSKQNFNKELAKLVKLSEPIPPYVINDEDSRKTQRTEQRYWERRTKKKERDLDRIRKQIKEEGIDVNSRCGNEEDDYPILLCAKSGNIEAVRFLLENGAKIDLCSKYGGSAITEAAGEGHIEMVKFLLSKGAPMISKGGSSSLARAAGRNRKDMVLFLLENGFDISKDRGLALANACRDGNPEIVKILLEKGANKDIHRAALCPSGGSMIVLAAEAGNLDVVKILINYGSNIRDTDADKSTVLHQAAKHGHAHLVSFFLEQGLDVNAKDLEGRTPLMEAARYGRIDAVTVLLHKGADRDWADQKKLKAIDYAAAAATCKDDTINGYRYDKTGAQECIARLKSRP